MNRRLPLRLPAACLLDGVGQFMCQQFLPAAAVGVVLSLPCPVVKARARMARLSWSDWASVWIFMPLKSALKARLMLDWVWGGNGRPLPFAL